MNTAPTDAEILHLADVHLYSHGKNYGILQFARALLAQRGASQSDAEEVLAAIGSGEYGLTRCQPSDFLSEDYNLAHAWMVERLIAPYMMRGFGATAIEALRDAQAKTLLASPGAETEGE